MIDKLMLEDFDTENQDRMREYQSKAREVRLRKSRNHADTPVWERVRLAEDTPFGRMPSVMGNVTTRIGGYEIVTSLDLAPVLFEYPLDTLLDTFLMDPRVMDEDVTYVAELSLPDEKGVVPDDAIFSSPNLCCTYGEQRTHIEDTGDIRGVSFSIDRDNPASTTPLRLKETLSEWDANQYVQMFEWQKHWEEMDDDAYEFCVFTSDVESLSSIIHSLGFLPCVSVDDFGVTSLERNGLTSFLRWYQSVWHRNWYQIADVRHYVEYYLTSRL